MLPVLATLECCLCSALALALARQATAQARAHRQGPIDIEPVLPEGAGWVSARGWWRHIKKCCLSCRSWTQQCIHRRVLDHVLPITSASHRHLCRHLACQQVQQVLCQLVLTATSATQRCQTPRVMQSCKDHNVALPNAQHPCPAPARACRLFAHAARARRAARAHSVILAPIRNSAPTHIKFAAVSCCASLLTVEW